MITALPKSLSLLTCLSVLTAAYAQTPTTPQPDRPQQNPASSASETDRILASWIMLENNNEIALSQLATTRAQNPEVKQFAQMMVKDHEEFGRKLARFSAVPPEGASPTDRTAAAGETGDLPGRRLGEDAGDAGTDSRPAGRRDAGVADASARRPMDSNLDHIALLRDLGRKHLESAKQELQQKQGAEFDHCFIGMQIAAHSKVLDQLQVFPQYASGELRNTFQQAQATVRQHLEKAKSIAKQMMEKQKTDKEKAGTDGK